jgi:hypothetical protein
MKKRRDMTCEEFTARMPQLVASGEDIFAHPHVKNCPVHRALLEDLEAIARAAQQLFPDVDPPDRVWAEIEGKIAPLGERVELVSDRFPGCHLVLRIKVMENWIPQNNSTAYDDHRGERNLPVPGTQLRAGRKPPPHPGEVR